MPNRKKKSPSSRLSARRTAIFFLLINTLVWGAALPFSKLGLEVTSAFFFLMGRFAVAALFTLPLLFWFLRQPQQLKKHIPRIIALEFLGTVAALGLLYTGLDKTTSLEASLITTTTPVFITIGGILFLHEKQERFEWFGLGLAFLGTLLLVAEPMFNGRWQQAEFSFLGNTLILFQNIAIAAYYLLAKKFYTGVPKLFVASVSFWVGFVSFSLLSFWEAGSWFAFTSTLARDWSSPAVWLAVGYMGVFGSIIGLTAYIQGQDGIEASEASLFTYLQPLVSIPLAWLLFSEQITPVMAVAVAIIFGGIFASEWRRHTKRYKKTPSSSKR